MKIEELVITDTETTGFDAERDAIIQLASIRVDQDFQPVIVNGKPDTFVSFVYPHPGAPLDKRAEQAFLATGIDLTKVYNAPDESRVATKFRAWLLSRGGSWPRFAGFNTDFDLKMLAAMQDRTGIAFPYLVDPAYCVLKRAKKILKHLESRRLVALCAHFQIPHANAHDAFADCEAARLVELAMRGL